MPTGAGQPSAHRIGHDLVLPVTAEPLVQPGGLGLDSCRDPWPGDAAGHRLASVGCACHIWGRAQTSGCAQGTAEALPGLLTVPGCSGFGVKPPRQALAPGLRNEPAGSGPAVGSNDGREGSGWGMARNGSGAEHRRAGKRRGLPGTMRGFLWPTEFLVFSDFLVADPHAHGTLQLSVGIDGSPRVRLDGA